MDRTHSLELQRRALVLLEIAIDLSPPERVRLLDLECGSDRHVRGLVEAMLAADREDTVAGSHGMILDRDVQVLMDVWSQSEGRDDDMGLIGQRIGSWRIRARIGSGGMGVVYHATRADGQFEQDAALKLIRFDTPATRERFRRERQILARLRHSGIAVVLDGGVSPGGAPYFVMELVNGQPIGQWCDGRRLGLRARVNLFCQAVDAISHAHRNLVVHRDLKPSNLLVTDEGRVKLLDFGIAEPTGEVDGSTRPADARVMTPQYAAPEQLQGDVVTTAADVYQLGLLLYQLLAGTLPYRLEGAPSPEHLQRRLEAMPALEVAGAAASVDVARLRGHDPASLGRALAGDLSAIVDACLRYQPERRYSSAAALADDLRCWLGGRTVSVRPATLRYRAGKFVARHCFGVAATIAMVIAILAGAAATLWQARQAATEAERARREAVNAQVATGFVERLFASATPQDTREPGMTARELLERGLHRARAEFQRDPELRLRLLTTIGQSYSSMGEHGMSHELFREALAIAGDVDPVIRGTAAYELASSSLLLGTLDEALVVRALQWIERDRRDEALVLRSKLMRLLGDMQVLTGRQRQGACSHQRARRLAERVAAIDPLPLLDVLSRQATIEWKLMNRPDKARATFKRAQVLASAVNPREADIRKPFLIDFLIESGELERAGAQIDGMLRFRRHMYGANSLGVAQLLLHRGQLNLELGHHREAKADFHELLRIMSRQGDAQGIAAVGARIGLSRVQCATREFEPCLRGATDARRALVASMGPNGLPVPEVDALLAEAHAGLRRHADAIAVSRRAIAGLERQQRTAGNARQTLGIALYRSGKTAEGIASLRDARRDLAAARGAFDAATLMSGVHMGRALVAQGDVDHARETLLALIPPMQTLRPARRHQALAEAYLVLAEVERMDGRTELARGYARRSAHYARQ